MQNRFICGKKSSRKKNAEATYGDMFSTARGDEGTIACSLTRGHYLHVTNRGTRRWPSGHRHPAAGHFCRFRCFPVRRVRRKNEMINISIHVLITSNVRVIKMIRQLMGLVGQTDGTGRKVRLCVHRANMSGARTLTRTSAAEWNKLGTPQK